MLIQNLKVCVVQEIIYISNSNDRYFELIESHNFFFKVRIRLSSHTVKSESQIKGDICNLEKINTFKRGNIQNVKERKLIH